MTGRKQTPPPSPKGQLLCGRGRFAGKPSSRSRRTPSSTQARFPRRIRPSPGRRRDHRDRQRRPRRRSSTRRRIRLGASPVQAAALGGGFQRRVNLLFLASPIYLIQVYGRVIPSGSVETLVGLRRLDIALAMMAVFDAVRARILVRAAARLDRVLAHRVFEAIIDLAPRNGAVFRNAQALRDLDQFRTLWPARARNSSSTCRGSALHRRPVPDPSAARTRRVAGAGLLLRSPSGTTGPPETAETAVDGRQSRLSVHRRDRPPCRSGPGDGHGGCALDPLACRSRHDGPPPRPRQRPQRRRLGVIRALRLGLQSAMIGVGGWLAIRGELLPASIFAAALLLGRALAPLEVAVGGWRQIVNAIAAGRRVQKALDMAPPRRPRIQLPDRNVEIGRGQWLHPRPAPSARAKRHRPVVSAPAKRSASSARAAPANPASPA